MPPMGEYAPGDASQLVGECDRQHIAVRPPLGRLDPGFEPVAFAVFDLISTTRAAEPTGRAGSDCRVWM